MSRLVSNSLQQRLDELLSSKFNADLKKVVRDCVAEAVKLELKSSFRAAFESSLLPAFQVSE